MAILLTKDLQTLFPLLPEEQNQKNQENQDFYEKGKILCDKVKNAPDEKQALRAFEEARRHFNRYPYITPPPLNTTPSPLTFATFIANLVTLYAILEKEINKFMTQKHDLKNQQKEMLLLNQEKEKEEKERRVLIASYENFDHKEKERVEAEQKDNSYEPYHHPDSGNTFEDNTPEALIRNAIDKLLEKKPTDVEIDKFVHALVRSTNSEGAMLEGPLPQKECEKIDKWYEAFSILKNSYDNLTPYTCTDFYNQKIEVENSCKELYQIRLNPQEEKLSIKEIVDSCFPSQEEEYDTGMTPRLK